MTKAHLIWPLLVALGCGSDASDSEPIPSPAPADAGVETTACPRSLGPADGPRRVVIGHPYNQDASKGDDYEVLRLSLDGALTQTGTHFQMGRARTNRIEMTADGQIGISVQEDGSLGVFRFDGDDVVVVHEGFEGSFYAEEILLSEDGTEALVVDPNWRNNGGGLYRISIACDGSLTDHGIVIPSKLARAIRRIPGTTNAVLTGKDVGESPTDKDMHVIDIADFSGPAVLASVDAFDDDFAATTAIQVTQDGRFALVADTSGFDGGDRIGVIALGASPAVASVIDIEDPYDILLSPFGNAIAVPSGFGDEIYAIGYDAMNATFSPPTALEHSGPAPALPGQGVVIERGSLAGLALVAENVGVRTIRFSSDGSVTDHGAFDLGNEEGDDLTAIVSAIGVTP